MLNYLNAKAQDYTIILSWAEQELRNLRQSRPEHIWLIDRLQEKIIESRFLHQQLRIIARIGIQRLYPRALPIIHDIELSLIHLTYYYLPALQRERKEDLYLRKILLQTANRCGLYWIKDIAVRLDNQEAIISVITECPVIFAPPQRSVSLLDIAGLYHELGHNVFQMFPDIVESLANVISDHFTNLRQGVGLMDPSKRAERERDIDEAQIYWNADRLNEFFSDIYATYICGPAFYYSSVDMAIKLISDPFIINPIDVHPPLAARVYACRKAINTGHQDEPLVIASQTIWNNYIRTFPRNARFSFICADSLLDRLVEASIQCIAELLNSVMPFGEPLPSANDLLQIPSGVTLESILNRAGKILLLMPDRYADWEKEALKSL